MAEGLSVHCTPLEAHIVGFSKSGKEDVVNGQPHTAATTAHASIHEQIRQTLTEIRQTLARIERQHNAQHPSPPEHFPPLPVSSSITTPFSHLRSPLTEIPYFSGQNVISWLSHIEQFFWKHQTPPEHKLAIAAVYLSGDALQWYTWMRTTRQISTWEFFSRDLEQKFGTPSSLTHKADLSHLHQASITSAYFADVAPLSIQSSGQIVAQKIPSVPDSRSAIVAASATVGVPARESDCSSPSPSRSETSDEVLQKAQLDLNRRDSGLTCMGWAPGAKLAASVGGFNNGNPNAKVLTRDEFGVWKALLPNETAGSAPTPHDSIDEAKANPSFAISAVATEDNPFMTDFEEGIQNIGILRLDPGLAPYNDHFRYSMKRCRA